MAVKTLVDTDSMQTLSNKTLTAPVIASISNGGILTMPVSTDTMVGRATIDTLSNKTLTAPVINGSVMGAGSLPSTITVPGTLTAGTPVIMNPFVAATKAAQAHGLGAIPAFIQTYLECLTGEQGYSVGDRIYLQATDSAATAYGFVVVADATNLSILTLGSGIRIVNKTTPAGFGAATSANWKIVAIPYKLN